MLLFNVRGCISFQPSIQQQCSSLLQFPSILMKDSPTERYWERNRRHFSQTNPPQIDHHSTMESFF